MLNNGNSSIGLKSWSKQRNSEGNIGWKVCHIKVAPPSYEYVMHGRIASFGGILFTGYGENLVNYLILKKDYIFL